jgi:hypothetical protein
VLERPDHLKRLQQLLHTFPVVGVVGPRQVGKTTLARLIAKRAEMSSTWFDLENPADLFRLGDPLLALESLRGLVVIDEIQHRPDLFKVLRVLADRMGFEFKRTTTPAVTKSMYIALDDLKLSSIDVIHAGRDTFPLTKNIRAVACGRIHEDLKTQPPR